MVDAGEARWAKRGRIAVRYVSAREMRPQFAIRGASAKLGEWILTPSAVHQVMRALITQRKLYSQPDEELRTAYEQAEEATTASADELP